jgi:MFS family permease
MLLITDSFYILAGALIGPIYALFVEKVGGDLLDASGAFAIFMITAAVVIFLLAFWEDRSKHQKKFVIAGYGIGVLGYLGYLFVNSTMSLFIVQAILGLSLALKDPAYDALYSDSKKHLALSWGAWEALNYLMLGVGALIGGLIAQELGFSVLLWCMFILSIISFLVSLRLISVKE